MEERGGGGVIETPTPHFFPSLFCCGKKSKIERMKGEIGHLSLLLFLLLPISPPPPPPTQGQLHVIALLNDPYEEEIRS